MGAEFAPSHQQPQCSGGEEELSITPRLRRQSSSLRCPQPQLCLHCRHGVSELWDKAWPWQGGPQRTGCCSAHTSAPSYGQPSSPPPVAGVQLPHEPPITPLRMRKAGAEAAAT